MQLASIKKFKIGDEIIYFKEPELGPGRILEIGIDHIVIYLGRNEWVTEYISYASVQFKGLIKIVLLKDIIKHSTVLLFESLQPGDLITIGKIKKTRAIVVNVCEVKKSQKKNISTLKVRVFDGFKKFFLPIKKEIEIIQRI